MWLAEAATMCKKKPSRSDHSCELMTLTAISESSDHGGKNGAAARLAKIERATAHATVDLGQRQKLVPLPNERPEVQFPQAIRAHKLIIGSDKLAARLIVERWADHLQNSRKLAQNHF